MTRIAASSKGFYCTAGGQLHRLNAEGKIQWSRKLPGSVDARGWYLAVGPDDTVYTDVSYGDYLFTSGDLFAYRADGTLKWKIGQGAVDSIPLVKDKTLYVGSYDNHLYAIDTTSGGIRWSTSLSGDVADPAMIESTLAVSVSNSDALYGVTRAGKNHGRLPAAPSDSTDARQRSATSSSPRLARSSPPAPTAPAPGRSPAPPAN